MNPEFPHSPKLTDTSKMESSADSTTSTVASANIETGRQEAEEKSVAPAQNGHDTDDNYLSNKQSEKPPPDLVLPLLQYHQNESFKYSAGYNFVLC